MAAALIKLYNPLKHYAWGSETAIPDLLGIPAEPGRPTAEMWIGAHPLGPSEIEWNGHRIPLGHWIAESPLEYLGARVCSRFDAQFPFLLKVLAAARPLSIQVHPDTEEAAAGFRRENEAGIALDDPRRTFKDPNPKPECVCALTPFWVMCGFLPIQRILSHFRPVADVLGDTWWLLNGTDGIPDRLRTFLKRLLEMDHPQTGSLLEAVRDRILRHTPANVIADWIRKLMEAYPNDIGSLAPLFMNVRCLQPGEALYLPPKTLHAYLEGMAIEIMVNSDNVVRGGLTSKHIDIPALLAITDMTSRPLEVLIGKSSGGSMELVYPIPEAAFRLSRIDSPETIHMDIPSTRGIEVYLCTKGRFQVSEWKSVHEAISVQKGESFVVPGNCSGLRLDGSGTLFRAFVP